MKALIVHLSDLHAKSDSHDSCATLGSRIGSAVKSLAIDAEIVIVAMTGDIAFSGRSVEYDAADKMVEAILVPLRTECQRDTYICMCPGNHDVDFSKGSGVREMAIASLASRPGQDIDRSIEDALVKPQEDFFSYAQRHSAWIPDASSHMAWCRAISHKGKTISVYSINTACASSLKEVKGQVFCPIHALDRFDPTQDEVSIVLLHHPYGWFTDGNANPARNLIERSADVILTGHEHEPGSYVKIKDLERTEYVEGGPLGSHDASDMPTFNTIVIDTSASLQTISQWQLIDDIFVKSKGDCQMSFHKNKRRLHGTFAVHPQWLVTLSEPGAGYVHPTKPHLSLDDIFLFPDFEIDRESGESETIRGNAILSTCLTERNLLILGPEFSGRTSIAKTLFTGLYNSSRIPLYLDAATIKGFSEKRFRTIIEESFGMQYELSTTERYWQLPTSDKLVILDNWERTGHLSIEDKNAWLRALISHFGSVIVFASNEVHYENVVVHKDARSDLLKFTQITIQDCGLLLRRQLVKKWFAIGGISTASEADTEQAITVALNYINAAINSGLSKAYAPMILLMLQALELKRPLTTASSSFIHLYDSLIKDALTRVFGQKIDPDKKSAVCERLAWHMFVHNRSTETAEQTHAIIHDLANFSLATIPAESTINELCAGKLISIIDGAIRFRYGYCYYYFVALYMAHHIDDESVQDAIKSISTELHNEHKANILLYLTYFNRDKRILETVLHVSRRLFSGYPTIVIDEFGSSLCSGFDRVNLVIPADDIEKNHERNLEVQDRLRREIERISPPETNERPSGRISVMEKRTRGEEKTVQVTIAGTNPDEALVIQSLNSAHKTIQILGQLMRNMPGTMSGEQKVTIAEECYALGMRMLSCVKELFLVCRDDIVRYLIQEDVFECRSKSRSEDHAKERALHIFCLIPQSLAFNIIKQISDSVGTSDYIAVYDQVINRHKGDRAFALIDTSVRLDHGTGFPRDLILQLSTEYRQTEYAYHILRRLVYQRMVFHKIHRDVRNEICAKLGIASNQAKLITAKSER